MQNLLAAPLFSVSLHPLHRLANGDGGHCQPHHPQPLAEVQRNHTEHSLQGRQEENRQLQRQSNEKGPVHGRVGGESYGKDGLCGR